MDGRKQKRTMEKSSVTGKRHKDEILYEGETKSRYFIDKTLMLEKIFGFIEEEVDGLYEKYLVDTVNPNGKLLDKFWSI